MCHGAFTRETTVDVASGECCDGRALALPHHPEQSYLIQKLEGADDLCMGSSMPPDVSLPDDMVALVRSWICEGAPDN
jgi:hypothetical protein